MAFHARPNLPFDEEIFEGPGDGRVITVIGKTRGDSVDFTVNLKTKSGCDLAESDVGLHVAVLMDKHEVVLNSLIEKEWQTETKVECPDLEDNEFKVVICIRDEHYQVSLNGKELGKLEHKVPRDCCKYILVNGTIDVYSIRFSGPGIRKTSADDDAEELSKDLKKMHTKQKDKKDKKKKEDKDDDEESDDEGDDDDKKKKKKDKKGKKDKDDDDESGEEDDGEKKKKKKGKKDKDDDESGEEDDDGEKKKKKKGKKDKDDDESGDEDGGKKKKDKKGKKGKDKKDESGGESN